MSLLDNIEGVRKKVLRVSGGCRNCPRKRIDFVPADLPASKVIVVGEAPGKEDVAQGAAFVGSSGQLLREHLRRVGIEQFAVTNAVHCRPPENTTLKAREIECCMSQFVLDEVRDYPFILLAGGTPLKAFFPGQRGGKMRGNVLHHPDFPGQRFYPIYHPAYVLRRPDIGDEFTRQIERFGRIVAGEPDPGWRILTPRNADFGDALTAALAAPLISLDIETNGLESWLPHSKILSLALTADGETVVFVHHEDPAWGAVLSRVRGYLERPEKHVLGHNIGFDLVWLEDELGFRVRCRGRHDTGTIYYETGRYKMPSLKELVSRELDGYRYLVTTPSEERDVDLLARYNAEDVIYPLRLMRKGMKELGAKTRDLVSRVSGPSGYVLRRMERNGFFLREDYRQQKIDEYRELRRAAVLRWKEADPQFIPNEHESGKGLDRYLFEIRQLPVNTTTEKGKPATDKSALKAWIRDGHNFLEHLLAIREIDKILTTYLTAYDKWIGDDGRLHSSYTNTFTDSGRSSSRAPNLQNIPRKRDIRDLFGVPAGHVLMESDLSQVEFRVMVSLARDANGIAGYLRGEDAHTLTAKSFAPEPTKTHRTWAKAVNFALLYGGDWYNVQRSAREDFGLDWSEKECREFVRLFWKTYPSFPAFHEFSRKKLIDNRGWFESVTGHVYRYDGWDHPNPAKRDHIFRSALNAEAQGPAAQICFLIASHTDRLLLDRGLSDVQMVNTVHDSILFDIPGEQYVPEVVRIVEEASALAAEWARPWLHVPLVMEHEVGESWGSLREYHLPSDE